MTVNYKSGTMVVRDRVGTVEQVRRTSSGKPEYFVRWANSESGWYLASNLHF
jgi:hypothetical protein